MKQNMPGVAQVRPQRVLPLQLDAHQAAVALLTRPINLNGSTTALAAELPLVESALPARAGCINVAVSEAMVALHDARPGRVIELPLVFGRAAGAGVDPAAGDVPGACAAPRSGKVQVFVRAVWRDYARQQGALVMDRADWLDLYRERAAIMIESGIPEKVSGPSAWEDTVKTFGPIPAEDAR